MSDWYMDDFDQIASILCLYTGDGEVEVRYSCIGDDSQAVVYLDDYFDGTRTIGRRALVEALEDYLGCVVLSDATVTIEWVESLDE